MAHFEFKESGAQRYRKSMVSRLIRAEAHSCPLYTYLNRYLMDLRETNLNIDVATIFHKEVGIEWDDPATSVIIAASVHR